MCFVLFFFFLMWAIFKVFIEFVTVLLLFYVFVFWPRQAYEILAPHPGIKPAPPALEGHPGIKPAPPALEGKVLTTGLPGKSLMYFSIE